MGVSVTWDNVEQTALCYTVTGRWTWAEFFVARDQARQLADSVGQASVNSIIDVRAGSLFPQNALLHLRRMPADAHPKLKFGTVIIVENNLFVRSLMDIMRRVKPDEMRKFHSARTLEQAHELMRKLETPLPVAV
ncbi:MAG: hypothetical protein ABI835_16105 [Chloroflexota bacterium]